jgi:hypothetical protein
MWQEVPGYPEWASRLVQRRWGSHLHAMADRLGVGMGQSSDLEREVGAWRASRRVESGNGRERMCTRERLTEGDGWPAKLRPAA